MRPCTHWFVPCFFFLAASLRLEPAASASGVTVITHGYSSSADDWVRAMADRIPTYYSFPGTNFTTYKVTLTTDGTYYYYEWARTNGSAPAITDSGEIIVKLDWSQMAGGSGAYDISTYDVAAVAAYVLLQTNAISELGGHTLTELPLHLIGHSRGGSLISDLSRQLGTNGVWVDHLTTLDPHPLNNDGFFDPLPVTDAPVRTYLNVLFHDNYWEDSNFYPYGESVDGAYVRYWSNLSGGYSSAHSDAPLWYHGTADWRTPTSDTGASITSTERSNWWVPYEDQGVIAGLYYGLIGGGNRLSTDQPLGQGSPAIRDGYNVSVRRGAWFPPQSGSYNLLTCSGMHRRSLPSCGQYGGDFRLFHGRKALQHLAQVLPGINPPAPAADDHRVNHCAAPARFRVSDEQPVLLPNRAGPNRIFGQIVVNLQASVFQIARQSHPLIERVADRFAHQTLRQMLLAHCLQPGLQSLQDGLGQLLPQIPALLGSQAFVPGVSFDKV